jgi:SecD/SecF fusion protein
MSKNLRTRFLVILGVILFSLFFIFPVQKRINLGLDLKGGMHLVLNVETDKIAPNAKNDAVLRAMEILRNRIDAMGAGETVIQRQGEDQIIVQLPGITDRKKALEIVGRVAHLEFKLVNSDPSKLKEALAGNIPPGYDLKETKKEHEKLLVAKESVIQGEAIADARVDFDQTGYEPKISLTLNSVGTKEFGRITQEHVGEQLAIVLDGEVMSAPNIREAILTGQAEISGRFTFEEASVLALALRSGALPAPMHVEEERTIGPLLGKDSIEAGIRATVIGGIVLIVFMSGYYLLGGVIASIALVINLLMIMGAMGFLSATLPQSPMTLTLPGIAGIILTLGMAVDANILINERIREELNNQRPLAAAINAGFDRALSAIIDSHVTSIFAAIMLFVFGSGPIKGFAVTLSIGLAASLFTAVYISRTFFLTLLEYKAVKTLPMLHLFGETKIDFISKRYFFYALSFLITVGGLFALYKKGEHAYGIDFVGGQIQEYRFDKPVSADAVRASLKENGIEEAVIQQFEKNPENVIIRTSEDTAEKVETAFGKDFANNHYQLLRIEKVGPVVGKALRSKAIWAITLAMLCIVAYVGFRFKHFDFAVAAIVALMHDVLAALGLLVVFGHQVDLLVVTALMTIAGYSINDTIVTYDRVRENLNKQQYKKLSLREIINLSVNQTLGRTVLTTGATLSVVVVLYLMGGEVLHAFALCLLIGMVTGAYSTIFIASPLVLACQRFIKKK